jgi:hypothetical protein
MPDFIRHIPLWAWAVGILVLGVGAFIGAIVLLVKVFRMRKHLGELPPSGKVAFWGSLLYTIMPIDILPDPIYLDDMAVVGTALLYLTHLWRKRHGADAPLPTKDSKPPTKVPARR